MNKILMLADGSQYAQGVCDHAAWAATRLGLPVEAAHVLGRPDTADSGDLAGALGADARDSLLAELAALDGQRAKLTHQHGRALLEAVKKRLLDAGVANVATRLRNGDVPGAIADLESDAKLIVIGKRGEAADFAKGHLGSNLERAVRTSRRPVLVAARTFTPPERFLIAYDGSPGADRTVEAAASDGLLNGIPCRLLSAGGETADGRTQLDRAAARLRAAGFSVEASVEPGRPEHVIARAMEREKTGLLVMGAYGHSRIRTLIVGSTTTEMLRSCEAPVLLYR